jgi:hypothetical protein
MKIVNAITDNGKVWRLTLDTGAQIDFEPYTWLCKGCDQSKGEDSCNKCFMCVICCDCEGICPECRTDIVTPCATCDFCPTCCVCDSMTL